MTYYEQTTADAGSRLAWRRSRNKAFIISEILTFVLAVGGVVLYATDTGHEWPLSVAALSLILYFNIRHADASNDKKIRELEDILSVCRKETDYLKGKYDSFDKGGRYTDPKHPFTTDIDIFGVGSLYQRVCRAVTTGGADALARALRLSDGPHDERMNAIAELASAELLTDFKRWGQRGLADTDAVRRSFGKLRELTLPSWSHSRLLHVLSWVYMVVFLCSLVLSIVFQTHLLAMVWWCVFNFFAVYAVCNRSMKKMTGCVGGLVRQLGIYVRLVSIIENTTAADPLLSSMQKNVAGAGESLEKLDNILQKLESRGNILGLFIFDMLFLWDYRILVGFGKWQKQYSNRFDEWIDTVSQYDMLVSMATFRYNEFDSTTDANVVDSAEVVFEAKGLYHPFLGSKAVRNDFSIRNRNFYIITGANMAGKSTFLRSLGINYVLAMNGMRVFAGSLTVSRFNLFTSMRTTDDLTHGISYFNAELLRLKQILDSISPASSGQVEGGDSPYLIILDEILKGTNSEDKLSGSRMFLEYVARKNVTGVIATHDLKLSAMAEKYPGRFHNYCFEIALGTDVTYTYRITPGVARNQNATFLLKKILTSPSK